MLKRLVCFLGSGLLWLASGQAAAPPASANPTPAVIVNERGPHHRVCHLPTADLPPAQPPPQPRPGQTYTELATGLHYFADGQWQETREEITIVDGVAAARQGPHQAAFAPNLNSPGAIELISPEGHRFRSHVLGLAYTDAASGRSVMIASVQDCAGALQPPNQVLYENALTGDCRADVRYTYTRRGFEQDVILRQAPPSPAAFGLDPERTRLEVFTEFLELPAHRHTAVPIQREPDRTRAARMAEPDLVDHQLHFGTFTFGPGHAFLLPGTTRGPHPSIPTGKSLETIGGRRFLIEKMNYAALRESLARLPQTALQRRPGATSPLANVALARQLPPLPTSPAGRWEERQLAQNHPPPDRPGLVIDYLAVNRSLVHWRFESDQTYLISDTVDLSGTTVLEGAVLKYAPGASLQVWGAIDCQTSTYQPALLTFREDNSVGVRLSSPPGTAQAPHSHAAQTALALREFGRRYRLHDISIRQADTAIGADPGVSFDLDHTQIANGRTGLAWSDGPPITCRNFLLANLETALLGQVGAPPLRGVHGTFHRIQQLTADDTAPCLLTNCLIVSVTNNTGFSGSHVVQSLSDQGVFQTAGGGAHYLPVLSPHRNAGTPDIDPALREQFRLRSTDAPILLRSDFTRDTLLRPIARRDTDQPDLGYHYPAIDYHWAGLRVANARLTVENGVTIGLDTAGVTCGLALDAGAQFVVRGQPHQLARLVNRSALQEAGTSRAPAANPGPFILLDPAPGSPAPAAPRLQWQFAESLLAGGAGAHLAGSAFGPAPVTFRDCQFAGGRLALGDGGLAFTNCLFDRVHLEVDASDDEPPRHFHQNFFRRGTVQIDLPTSTQVLARNNFFEQTSLRISGQWHHSHNAYVAGHDRLPPAQASDRVVNEVRFQPGPLGPFYYPATGPPGTLAGLVDAGSDPAPSLGLAHYTTRPGTTREGISRVDIGFHYVAVDARGRPLDRDGDGVPDYREDTNGNELADAGETDWQFSASTSPPGGRPVLHVFTPLK